MASRSRSRHALLLVVLTGMTLTFGVASRGQSLTIIDLQHRTAEELLPVLQPLAGRGAITGQDHKLLVRAEPADVARIREALAVLDRAPRSLRVSVRFDRESRERTQDVRIGRGANATTVLTTADDSSVSSVELLEGSSAHVATGQSLPVVTAALSSRSARAFGAAVDYRDVSTGFKVTPRLNKDIVLLDIAAQQQEPNSNGAIATQAIGTTLSARLEEWVQVAGVAASGSSTDGALRTRGGSTRTATRENGRTVWVKVTLVE